MCAKRVNPLGTFEYLPPIPIGRLWVDVIRRGTGIDWWTDINRLWTAINRNSRVNNRLVDPVYLSNGPGSLFPIRCRLNSMEAAVITPLPGCGRIDLDLIFLLNQSFMPTGVCYVGGKQ
jgi:hypothetical protein